MRTRKHGEPGRYLPAASAVCSYDGGNNSAPICGEPAAWHLQSGDPAVGPGDFAMLACDEHVNLARAISYDWHEFGGVCDMPGTKWMFGSHQGEGFCFWPEAEAVMHEQVAAPQEAHV